MLLTFVLLFGLLSTPVATPISIGNTPEWAVPFGVPAAVEPLLTGDLVVIAGHDRTVVALDVATGQRRWSAVLNEEVGNPMAAIGDIILLPGAGGTLIALSAESGEIVTAISLGVDQLTEPVILNDTIVVSDTRGTVSLLDADTLGMQRTWVVPDGVWRTELVGNLVVVASGDGTITAINVDQAAINWQAVVNTPPATLHAARDGNVLLGLSSGDMVMLNGGDGTVMWQQVYTNGGTRDVAVTANEILVTSTRGDLLVLDPADGTRIWQGVLPAGGWFGSDHCEHHCFIATSDGGLTTFSVAEMELSTPRIVPGGISVPPVANNSVAVVVTSLGDVSAWSLGS